MGGFFYAANTASSSITTTANKPTHLIFWGYQPHTTIQPQFRPFRATAPGPKKLPIWGPVAKPYRRGSPWALVMLLGRAQASRGNGGFAARAGPGNGNRH
ncbi:MAG: hypothetical protein EAY75_05275 [Bacteroidetes bacterium]|nr:MAG: hypothetical protein EAY75_05275 [Bacteroidota bacterium]